MRNQLINPASQPKNNVSLFNNFNSKITRLETSHGKCWGATVKNIREIENEDINLQEKRIQRYIRAI